MTYHHHVWHVMLAFFILALGFYFIVADKPTVDSAVIVEKDPYVYCIISEQGKDYVGVSDAETCCGFVEKQCFPLDGKLKLLYNDGIFSYYADYFCFNEQNVKAYFSEGVYRGCVLNPNPK